MKKVFFMTTCLCIVLFIQAQVNLTNGLVAYYPFNGNANDESGNNHNATVYGGSILTVDRFDRLNSAYGLDGNDDYIALGSWFNFQKFSIFLWVKPGDKQTSYANIIDNNHTDYRSWVMQQWGSQLNQFYFGSTSGVITNAFILISNQWHSVAIVHDSTSFQLYIDNKLIEQKTITQKVVYDGSQNLSLGHWGGGGRFLKGNIDDVRIYNRALSEDEIAELYYEKPTDVSKIYDISPNLVNKNDSITDLTISAYPISTNCRVELVNGNTIIKPDTILKRDKFYTKARFSWENKPLGLYNVLLISDTDTLKLDKGFRIISLSKPIEPLDTDNDGFRNITDFGNILWITQHSESWSYKYELDNDLDGSETQYWNDGEGLNPITTFSGIFDGQSHKIRNLYYNSSSNDNIAFIGTLASGGIVRNLGLTNCSVTGNNYTAGLVANNNGTISNCYCSGTVSGTNYVGGIAGTNNGTIKCSYNDALITGNTYIGGVAGYSNSNSSSVISKSFNSGKVIGENTNIGGVIGTNNGIISDCYNAGSVVGAGEVAGIAGWNYGAIQNTYNKGYVNGAGNYCGAMIGYQSGSITNSFWDQENSGLTTSNGGTGKSPADMKTQSTYTNWDFTNTWEILSTMNDGYPKLTWATNTSRIQSYTPDRTANVDSCTITFEGSGFNDSTKIFLSRTGQTTIKADTVTYCNSYCTALFNLKNAAPGTWNILVQYPDTTITLQNGLTIEEKKEGKLKVEILGSSVARIGRDASFTINVTNLSNFEIENPCIEIAVSSIDSTFKVYSEEYNTVDKEIFNILGSDVREFYFTKTDDILGQNRNCKSGLFFLPNMSAYESKELLITVRSAGNYTISAWHNDYTIDQFAEDAINVVYTDGNTYNYQKSAKLRSLTAENICNKIYADCYNNFMSDVNNALAASAKEELEGQLLDLIPIKPLKSIMKNGFDMAVLYKNMNECAKNGDVDGYVDNATTSAIKASFFTYTQLILSSIASNNKVIEAIENGEVDRLMMNGMIRSAAKNEIRKEFLEEAESLAEKVNKVDELAGLLLSYGSVEALRSLQAKKMCTPSLKDCNVPDSSSRHDVSTVSSCDPNEKIGYRSPSGSTYFNADNSNFTYIVNFENKETATAAAQEVVVRDTLDLRLFNINSFRAGYIKIGNTIYQAPYNVKENKWQIDMRPGKNLITNVTLTLDTINGIAKWDFKSLDPTTMDWPQDLTLGFLPPNDSIGSGLGSVSFTINLKDNLTSDISVKNKANIVFDTNTPMTTPTWTNTKDVIAPISTMSQPTVANDSIATLNWTGEDNKGGSGVYQYNVYVKQAGGSYSSLLSNVTQKSVDFQFKKGTQYDFYVTAIDSTGNTEVKTNVPDVTLMITAVPKVSSSTRNMIVFPNPSSNGLGVYVTFDMPDQEMKHARLVITSMLGSMVKETNIKGNEIHIKDIGSGMFIFDLQVNGESIEHQKVVIQ